MPDLKDEDPGFLRRVYRFITQPATEWAPLDPQQDSSASADVERSDLQVMIERKRRNDFVRKQEFELLRRIRREGLTGAQIRALGEDRDHAATVAQGREAGPVPGEALRGKIDELEKTMILDARTVAMTRAATTRAGSTPPEAAGLADASLGGAAPAAAGSAQNPHERHSAHGTSDRMDLVVDTASPPRHVGDAPGPVASEPSVSRWHPMLGAASAGAPVRADPPLEEAAFFFAQAEFLACETELRRMIASGAERERHTATWLTLLDLYRATGQHQRFEATAADYENEFGMSPGGWVSIPQLAAGVSAAQVKNIRDTAEKSPVSRWVCPSLLDGVALSQLVTWARKPARQRHLDWSPLQMIDSQAATALVGLMGDWAGAARGLHWTGIDRLFDLLDFAAAPGDASADPVFWKLRLATLKLLGRQGEFEAAAQHMRTLYAVEALAWKPPRQTVRTGEPAVEAGRSEFMVTTQPDAMGRVRSAQVDLAGQLTGDIAAGLAQCDAVLGEAEVITVDCERLVRVDFVAAGELINWVAERRAQRRLVHFRQVHRLVAVFFCAMGLDDHAPIEVRA